MFQLTAQNQPELLHFTAAHSYIEALHVDSACKICVWRGLDACTMAAMLFEAPP